jgi:hypothetical protein
MIDIKRGELLITDEMIKKFPEELHLYKNYLEVSKFLRNNPIKITHKFPHNFAEQMFVI